MTVVAARLLLTASLTATGCLIVVACSSDSPSASSTSSPKPAAISSGSPTPASTDSADAQRFVGTWTYTEQADETFACPNAPIDIDASSIASSGPPPGAPAGTGEDGGGGPPDASVTVDDAGTARFGRKSRVAVVRWSMTGNQNELQLVTDEPCTWLFAVQGNVATMKPHQSCSQYLDPNELGLTTIAANESSTYRISDAADAITEDLVGLLGGICTAERKGSLRRQAQ